MSAFQEHTIGRRRIVFLRLLFLFLFALLSFRLFMLQIVAHPTYVAKAKQQHTMLIDSPAKRGELFAATALTEPKMVATNLIKPMVYAIPPQVKDPLKASLILAPILSLSQEEIKTKLQSKSFYVPLKKHLSAQQEQQIRGLELPGIALEPEQWRYFPEGKWAGPILGFVNHEKKGQYGLEEYLDEELRGSGGKTEFERDTQGRVISYKAQELNKLTDGKSFELTPCKPFYRRCWLN